MPLPAKLKKTASKKKKTSVMQKTMHELKHSPVKAPSRKATSGAQRHKQDVAIALQQSGQSKKKKAKKKGTHKGKGNGYNDA
jgi:hypothetical protein